MKAGDNRGRIDRSIFGIVKYYIVSSLKMKYFILVLTIMLGGCYQSERFDLDFSNKTYMEELAYFRKEFVDHFPIRIFEDNIPFQYKAIVSNQYECISMKFNANYSKEKIEQLMDSLDTVAAAVYGSSDTCLLIVNRFHTEEHFFETIKLTENKRQLIDRNCYKDKLPIQNFYTDRFTKNETEWNLPKDFTIYVLEARKGKFWNDEYLYGGRYMPPEWEHGFSKGVAISMERNVIIYWFVIW